MVFINSISTKHVFTLLCQVYIGGDNIFLATLAASLQGNVHLSVA